MGFTISGGTIVSEGSNDSRSFKSVLVVNNEVEANKLVGFMLSSSGLDFDVTPSVDEAVRMAASGDYCTVITDTEVGGASGGARLYSELTRAAPEMKGRFIFMTDELTPQTMNFLAEEECEYIGKPFSPSELMKKIVSMKKAKGDADRRSNARFNLKTKCRIKNYMTETATVEDISSSGLKVNYRGRSFTPHEEITLTLKDHDINVTGMVMWSATYSNGNSSAGLRVPTRIPVQAIINVYAC